MIEIPELTIRLFGRMEVSTRNGVVHLSSRRAGWLLGILSLHAGQPMERQALAGMLWPDSTDEAALHNLRQMLVRVRKALGSEGYRIKSVGRLSILLEAGPGLWIDVVAFDQSLWEDQKEMLERGAEIYRGPLLAECHEPFAVQERELRDQSFLKLCERLGAIYLADHEYTRANQLFRRAMAVDPYRESTVRSLMRCLLESGEAAAALDAYRRLRQALRSDLDALPDPETTSLYRTIRSSFEKPNRGPVGSGSPSSQLPKPMTSLIGRETEIREIVSALELCRLVTLVGLGGVGKTRLALAVAEAANDRFLDGSCCIDLSLIREPHMVLSSIAGALKMPEHAGRPLMEALCEWLAPQSRLLVVDNCEHLVEASAEALGRLLSSAPNVQVLATSRELLGVPGEYVRKASSLAAPDEGATDLEVVGAPAVKLFLERSRPPSKLESRSIAELRTIGTICRRLDGIPLAIELAAARTNVLSVFEIEERLSNRFGFLEGGSRAVPRHQTLRAMMDWSWELLSQEERDLLSELSVFRGGATFAAMEWVHRSPALNVLSNLIDRSLVVCHQEEEGNRFSLLETVRQYGLERLKLVGDWEDAQRLHRDFFYDWVQEVAKAWNEPREFPWVDQLEKDHDNLRAALDWCHSQGDQKEELHLAVCLSSFWDTYGHLREGRRLLERALVPTSSDLSSDLVAEACEHAGWMAYLDKDCAKAKEHYEVALTSFRQSGNRIKTAHILNLLACSCSQMRDFDEAEILFDESFALFRELERPGGSATVLSNRGEAAIRAGDLKRARTCFEESIVEGGGPEAGSSQRRALTFLNLAVVNLREDRLQDARKYAMDAVFLFDQGRTIISLPTALDVLAVIEAQSDSWERATQLFGAAEVLIRSQGIPRLDLVDREREASIAGCHRVLQDERFHVAFQMGRQMSLEGAVDFALNR